MSTAPSPVKIRRKDVPEGKVLCEYCTAKCCRYFALPIETPETFEDYEFIRWFLLHDRATVFKEDEDWYLLVHTECEHLQIGQPLRHLRNPPANLPRLHDQRLRVRRRLDLRLLPRNRRPGGRIHGSRPAEKRQENAQPEAGPAADHWLCKTWRGSLVLVEKFLWSDCIASNPARSRASAITCRRRCSRASGSSTRPGGCFAPTASARSIRRRWSISKSSSAKAARRPTSSSTASRTTAGATSACGSISPCRWRASPPSTSAQLGTPFKRYHIATVWRGENTQRGRYREFMQCDFDTIGTTAVAADVETLLVVHDSARDLGVGGFTIRINHRGILTGLVAKARPGREIPRSAPGPRQARQNQTRRRGR